MWDRGTMGYLRGFGDTPAPAIDPTVAAIIASIAPLAQAGLQAWDQQSILDMQKALIAAGKPPLTADQISQLMAGVTPGVSLGLSTDTQTLVKDALIGAAVLVGGFLLLKAIK